jgi:hypothetical protein
MKRFSPVLRLTLLVLPLSAACGLSAAPPGPVSWQRPEIYRHYPHIRIAMVAYSGIKIGPFEDRLLRDSVDLVIPNGGIQEHVHQVAPHTPMLCYTNTSNLYLDLLADWLVYADRHGLPREAAFYHAARPVPFRGTSPSSQPVTWFWGVRVVGRSVRDLTSAARSPSGRVPFPNAGGCVYLGYPERFREINLRVLSPAADGWSAVLEYARAADDDGRPTAWAPLAPRADSTERLTRSGRLTFDPPADWKPTAVGGPAPLYYVRFRATTVGATPVAGPILGRDYVNAGGKNAGTIPVFDDRADANGDGYLDDAEYARRASGKDARFRHESRMFAGYYGQMRFATNPADRGFRAWCVDYNRRLLQLHPLAGGLFLDNSNGKPQVTAADVREPVKTYAADFGKLVHAVAGSIAPKLVLENTAAGQLNADAVIRQNPAYFEEFAIRPLANPWPLFEDLAATVARRAKLTSPPPYAVIDSHPQKGDPLDPRMQLGTLACYYLLADPDSTFLMINGGNEPATPWKRHWVEAAAGRRGPGRCSPRAPTRRNRPTSTRSTSVPTRRRWCSSSPCRTPAASGSRHPAATTRQRATTWAGHTGRFGPTAAWASRSRASASATVRGRSW